MDSNILQTDVLIQYKPTSISFFLETDMLTLENHIKTQGIQNSQNNLKKEQSWKTHASQFQSLLQSHSNLRQCGTDERIDI